MTLASSAGRGFVRVAVGVARGLAGLIGGLRDAIADGLLRAGIAPNAVTLLGPVVSLGVAFAWAKGEQRLGGLLLVATGATDLIDGTMARRSGLVTRFGGFLDAVVDRYSDLVVAAGLLLFFARLPAPGSRGAYLTAAALCVPGAILPAYVRARAEMLIPTCKVGYLERAERTVASTPSSCCRHARARAASPSRCPTPASFPCSCWDSATASSPRSCATSPHPIVTRCEWSSAPRWISPTCGRPGEEPKARPGPRRGKRPIDVEPPSSSWPTPCARRRTRATRPSPRRA